MATLGFATDKWLPFPLVSCWLRQPAIGIGANGHTIIEPWPEAIPPEVLAAALTSGQSICCATPLVSPRGLNQVMVHEWYADTKLIDSIPLRELTTEAANETPQHPYHIHSCKSHFPRIDYVLTLSCRVRIAKVVVGSVGVRVE